MPQILASWNDPIRAVPIMKRTSQCCDVVTLFSRGEPSSGERLAKLFSSLPFEPYAPVRRQLLVMLNQVNRARRVANLEPLPTSCLRLRRKPRRPLVFLFTSFKQPSGNPYFLAPPFSGTKQVDPNFYLSGGFDFG